MKIFTSGLLLSLITIVNLFSQAIIEGYAPSYANDTLKIIKFQDFFTNKKEVISKLSFDKDGYFKAELDNSDLSEIGLQSDNKYIIFFVYPKKNHYILLLPKKDNNKERSQEIFLEAIVTNEDSCGLNFHFSISEKILQKYSLFLLQVATATRSNILDTINKKFQNFANCSDSLIKINYKYTYANLLYISDFFTREYFIKEYFAQDSFFYNIPAYQYFFNIIFSNFFSINNDLIEFKNILDLISQEKPDLIVNYLIVKFKANATLSVLVTLKGLYDLYYEPIPEILKLSIVRNIEKLQLPDEFLFFKNNVLNELKKWDNIEIFKQVPFKDLDGNEVYITKFNGKFVYLIFYSFETMQGVEHFDLLEKLIKKNPKLQPVVIYVGKNYKDFQLKMKKFSEKYKIPYFFLNKENNVFNEYSELSLTPSYFLLDDEGNILSTEAPSPVDNFEKFFESEYVKWKNKKAQQQNLQLNENN